MILSERTKKMKASPTLALNAKAKELSLQGFDVVALSVGEPDWNTFEEVNTVAKKAIDDGNTKYSPSSGIMPLRKVIAASLSNHLNIPYSAEQVSVTSGAKFSIFSALQCLINPGDEVIVPAPYWVSYPTMIHLAEGKEVIVSCDSSVNFKLSASSLEKAISSKTKLLLLNSPSNPTGMMYSLDELKSIADVLSRHEGIYLLTDDIYNQLVFEEFGRAPHILQVAPSLAARTIMIDGASKAYSMTGWRLGWSVGPLPLIQAITNYQSQTVSCAATFSQHACIEAVANCKEQVSLSVKNLKERRDYFSDKLKTISGLEVFKPDGTFYFWVSIKDLFGKSFNGKAINDSSVFSSLLLEEEKLVVVPGIEFGLEGYIRMSFAVDKESLDKACSRLNSFISKLN